MPAPPCTLFILVRLVRMMGLLSEFHSNLDNYIHIGEVLLQVSFQKQEPFYNVAQWAKFKHFEQIEIPLYKRTDYDFIPLSPTERQEIINNFLDKLIDLIPLGSARDWVYSGKYESFAKLYGYDNKINDLLFNYSHFCFNRDEVLHHDILKDIDIIDFTYPRDNVFQQIKDQQVTIATQAKEITALKSKIAELGQQAGKPAQSDTPKDDSFYDWQSMDKHSYPPELHLAMQVWQGLNSYNFSTSHSDFSTRFNIIAKQLGIPQGKLFERIKTTLTPLVSKTQSQTLINSLIGIPTISTEKLDD